MALDEALSAEEQAQIEAMRAADAQPGSEAAAATEAPSPEPEAKPEPQTKMVPHQALHEERELRKERERELAQEKERSRLLEQRTNTILERFAAPQQPQPAEPQTPAIPDLDKDPVGHIVGTMQQQGATLQQIVGALSQFGQQTERQQAVAELQTRSAALEREFSAQNPDYAKAVDHLTAARHQELAAIGYTDPAQRQAIIAQDALQVAGRAIEAGKNPAEFIYALAQQRGYKPAAPSQQEAGERLQRVAAGQAQSRSLSSANGGAAPPLTAQRLAEMSDAEFAKAIQTPEGRGLLGA